MNKAELISKISDDAGITKTQSNLAVDSFVEAVTKTL
jgi:DNA-binding protein HU-beta